VPRDVLARGDVVVRDGEVVSKPGRGRFVHRECVGGELQGAHERALVLEA